MADDWCVRCLTRRSRFPWPRGRRRRSAASRLLVLRLWIPPGSWTFFCCECSVLPGRVLCDWTITRPEDTYRVWRVCDHEASIMRMPWPISGVAPGKKSNHRRNKPLLQFRTFSKDLYWLLILHLQVSGLDKRNHAAVCSTTQIIVILNTVTKKELWYNWNFSHSKHRYKKELWYNWN